MFRLSFTLICCSSWFVSTNDKQKRLSFKVCLAILQMGKGYKKKKHHKSCSSASQNSLKSSVQNESRSNSSSVQSSPSFLSQPSSVSSCIAIPSAMGAVASLLPTSSGSSASSASGSFASSSEPYEASRNIQDTPLLLPVPASSPELSNFALVPSESSLDIDSLVVASPPCQMQQSQLLSCEVTQDTTINENNDEIDTFQQVGEQQVNVQHQQEDDQQQVEQQQVNVQHQQEDDQQQVEDQQVEQQQVEEQQVDIHQQIQIEVEEPFEIAHSASCQERKVEPNLYWHQRLFRWIW
jgi:hypothetical protein